MPDFTLPELNADQGTNTGNNLRNAANAAANVVCNLYQNAPTGLIPSVGDPFGIGAFNQGLFDNLCRPRNKIPPDPQLPFSGGQCPVQYKVNYVSNYDGASNAQGFVFVTGPVRGITVTRDGGDANYMRYKAVLTSASPPVNIFNGAGGLNDGKSPATCVVTSIVRTDALPDTCGNPPVVYPTRDPVPSDYDPVPVPIGDRGTIVNIPVTIIPTLIRPDISF